MILTITDLVNLTNHYKSITEEYQSNSGGCTSSRQVEAQRRVEVLEEILDTHYDLIISGEFEIV